jgi:uncharacterized membrane protein YidH (DUF202 family)
MDTSLLDDGAQAERTALAWQRTAIASMAVAALLIHARLNGQLWAGLILAGSAAIAVLVLVPWRYRCVLRAVRAGRTPVSRPTVLVTAVLSVFVIIFIAAELLLN